MKAKISKRTVDALRPGESIADTEIRGFIARRLPSGLTSYDYRFRDRKTGRRPWINLGLHGSITADQARALAKQRAGEVAAGRDPSAERTAARATATNTLDSVLDQFLERHVRAKGLRTADEIERVFRVYVRGPLGKKSIYELQRRDIVALLDGIEDNNGPVQADRALAYLRKCFNWFATRDDGFSPPIVRGMSRAKPAGERARTRVLDDTEIRDLWRALDELKPKVDAPACYAPFVKALLLSAQRREELSRLRWEEIEGTTWTIPAERSKNKLPNYVPLSAALGKLIADLRKPGQKVGFAFSTDGGSRAFSGFSKAKAALDGKITTLRKRDGGRPPMVAWVHHDLRRTARSLMSRAGVPADIAERVLGHVIAGVRGVYDRHAYFDEKGQALEKLAALVERILRPTEAVVPFPRRARRVATRGTSALK